MSQKKPLYDKEKQEQYEREARLQYGADSVNASIKRWNSYSEEKQAAILAEGGQIYNEIVEAMQRGIAAQNDEVQVLIQRWHDHLRYFYEPTLEIMRGLAETYKSEPGFIEFFKKIHADLPEYLSDAIVQYVDVLEYAEIERLIAEDDANRRMSRLT